MTTKEQILNIFSDCEFDGILTTEQVSDKIFQCLPSNFIFDWNEGASKLVILPKDKDYVIKIPYTGNFYGRDPFNKEYGDFVFANDTDKYNWDYCFTEMLLYREAKRCGVDHVFAKETLIGTINGHPLYMQERANVLSEIGGSSSEEDCEKTGKHCETRGYRVFADEGLTWQADALAYYGDKKFDKIMDFIEWKEIGDLHEANLGYIGARPIIFDFSDFMDAG